jgi:hypothetical protein
MRFVCFIFILAGFAAAAQTDKVFLKNGEVKKGIVLSVGLDFIFYKASDTSRQTQKILKNDILLVEKYDGKVYVFGKENMKPTTDTGYKHFRHSIGVQPLDVMFGRITGVYEFVNKRGTLGIAFPVSLTFDPIGPIYSPTNDTTKPRANYHTKGLNFIAGGDLNFYIGKKERRRFFVGPRVRYGVDMFLINIEGYSIQSQFGWKFMSSDYHFYQQLALGFGFVRILSSPAGNRINPKESYSWASFTYRIGFGW